MVHHVSVVVFRRRQSILRVVALCDLVVVLRVAIFTASRWAARSSRLLQAALRRPDELFDARSDLCLRLLDLLIVAFSCQRTEPIRSRE